jgi:hypothetical protein
MILTPHNFEWVPNFRTSTYITGPSGSGKSTLMYNWCADLLSEHGIGIIDPHGDLIEDILKIIPRHRIKDVVYFSPVEFPIGLNVIEYAPGQILRTEHQIDAFKGVFHIPPESERLLRHLFILHSYQTHSTLIDTIKTLRNEEYLKKNLQNCLDSLTRDFWESEYPLWFKTPRFQADRVDPVLTAIETLLAHPSLRAMFSVTKSKLDFRKVMDNGQIFLCNLSRGTLGDTASSILGALIIAQFRSAAFSRANSDNRNHYLLMVDEFHEFAGERVINSILSGTRKYGLSLALAHQYSGQSGAVEAALANCHTKIAFPTDDEIIQKIFTRDFNQIMPQTVLVKEGRREFVGEPKSKYFPTLGESLTLYARKEQIKNHSRLKFSVTT